MTTEKIDMYFTEFTSFSEQLKQDVMEELEKEKNKENEKKKQAEFSEKQ